MDEFQLSYTAQDINKKLGKIDSKLDSNRLPDAINQALEQAKARGEFDGKDGYTPVKGVDYFDGKDGYTPVKGVDYVDGKDGYTPQKGIDYFDGQPGKDGKDGSDGYTPIKGVDYFDGEPGKDGYTPVKGVDYFDGVNGKDGYTPVKDVDYFDGKDGNTPVKGVDYYTDAEKQEMVTDVLALVNDNLDSLLPELNQGNGLPEVSTSDNGKILGVVNGEWQSVTPEVPEELPTVTASDNGNVLTVVNGQWQSATPEFPDVQTEIPVFDLAEMGLTAVAIPEGMSSTEADTADIVEALGNGEVKFAIPVSMEGNEFPAYLTMQGFTDGTGFYQCSASVILNTLLFIMVVIDAGSISVQVKPITNFIDDYLRTALEGDY